MVTDSIYSKYRDERYCEFVSRLSTTDNLPRAGIRIPILRQLAKTVSFGDIDIKYHEDVILKGFSLAQEKVPFIDKIERFNNLLPYLSSWDQTDTIQSAFKPKKKDTVSMCEYFESLLTNKELFTRRIAIIWIMSNRNTFGWEKALNSIIQADSENEYYIMMAVAWALSVFYIDNPSIIDRFSEVSETTKKKAIQKIKESNRYKGGALS